MTEAQSTLERMALAVKNAHTAITVLKKENEGLKSENQSLKDQLAALQGKLDLCSCGNQQKETKQKNSNQKVDANNTAALSNNWGGTSSLKLSASNTVSSIPHFIPSNEVKPCDKTELQSPPAVKGTSRKEKAPKSADSIVSMDKNASKIGNNESSCPSEAFAAPVTFSSSVKKPSRDWDSLLAIKLIDFSATKDAVTPAILFGKLNTENYQSVAKGLLKFPVPSVSKLIPEEIQKWITKFHIEEWKRSLFKVLGQPALHSLPEELQEKLNLLTKLLLSMCAYSTNQEGYETCMEITRKLFYLFIASIRLRQGQSWVSMHVGMHDYDSAFAALTYAEHIHAPPSHFFEGTSTTKVPEKVISQENISISKSKTDNDGAAERTALLASMFDFSSDEEEGSTEEIEKPETKDEDNECMQDNNDDNDSLNETDNQSGEEEVESEHSISDEDTVENVDNQRNIATIISDAMIPGEDETLIEENTKKDVEVENNDSVENYEDVLLLTDIRDYCLLSLILSIWKTLEKFDLIKFALEEYSQAINVGHSLGGGFAILEFMHSLHGDGSSPSLNRKSTGLLEYFRTKAYPVWLNQIKSLNNSAALCGRYAKRFTDEQFILHSWKYEKILALIAQRSEQFSHFILNLNFLPHISSSIHKVDSTHSIGIWAKMLKFASATTNTENAQSSLKIMFCGQWSNIAKSFQLILYTYVRNILFPEENLAPVDSISEERKEATEGIFSLQEVLSLPLTDIIYSKFGYHAGFPQLIETCRAVTLSSDTAFGSKLTREEYLSIEWENKLIDSYYYYWHEIFSGTKLHSPKTFADDDEDEDSVDGDDLGVSDNTIPGAAQEIHQNVLNSVEQMFTFFQDSLLIYYDSPQKYSPAVNASSTSSGWRGGNIGEGGHLSNYLKTRLSIMRDFLVKVQGIVQRLRPTSVSHSTLIKEQLNSKRINMYPFFWHYSSVLYPDLHDCVSMIAHLQEALLKNYSVYDEEFTPTERQAFHKLRLTAMDMIGLIGIAELERLYFIFVSSCRGLLRALHVYLVSSMGKNLTVSQTILSLVKLCIRILEESPNPWGSKHRLDMQYEIISVTELILQNTCLTKQDGTGSEMRVITQSGRNSFFIPSFLYKSYQDIYNRYIYKYQKEISAFVINLDRRSDRWKRLLLRVCPLVSLNLLRVSAIDGKFLDPLSISSEMDTGSKLTTENADLQEVNSIPESDVCTTWDSTLNAKFDSRCIVNEHVPMTPSERACAASHLKVWRMIAAMAKPSHDEDKMGTPLEASVKERKNMKEIAEGEAKMSKKLWTMMHSVSKSAHAIKPTTANVSVKTLQHFFADSATSIPDYYLILEDDASIQQSQMKAFKEELHKLVTKAPDNWDIIYLGGVTPYKSKFYHEKIVKHGLFYQMNYAWMLHGYVLRASSATKLLYHLPINAPVDNFIASLLYDQELVGLLAVEPLILQVGVSLSQRKEDSNIRHSGVSMLTGQTTASRENFLTSAKIARAESMKGGNIDKRRKRKKSVNIGGRRKRKANN